VCEDVDWINMGQDRVKWHVIMNTVMNFQVI
jgi:hypothetical protein